MDILRKELTEIYDSQKLDTEELNPHETERCRKVAELFASVTNGCTVITDASCDHCYLYIGAMGMLLGVTDSYPVSKEMDSSDEDIIYNRIHPEDIVDKRMLEYEFFRFTDLLSGEEKQEYQATCRIRIRNHKEGYTLMDNTTQIICPSPAGKIWLIMCTYSLASDQKWSGNIQAAIKNNRSGEITALSFNDRRQHILTEREKEILMLIKEGKASKQIADILGISVHTVNRHRQNILEKLSVANSIEAITAVEAMRLL